MNDENTAVNSREWVIYDPQIPDSDLVAEVLAVFKEFQPHFAGNRANHQLSFEIRALRHHGPWRVFLLLTPWHLARIFIPKEIPNWELPEGWSAPQRKEAPFTVIGPGFHLPILSSEEQAHLNYHSRLGHYFIQPLIQSLLRFHSAEEVFEAWNKVIQVRNRNISARRAHCEWQEEVSRREFFTRWTRGASS